MDPIEKIGPRFLANTTTHRSQQDPSIATLSDNRFVITWSDNSRTGSDTTSWAVARKYSRPQGKRMDRNFWSIRRHGSWR